jgi:hypothetical protein
VTLPIQAPPVIRQRGTLAGILRAAIFPQDNCSTCENILTHVIKDAAKASCWLGCKAVGIAAGAACDAAFGGPEDPIGDLVCPVVGAGVYYVCNKYGCDELKHSSGAGKAADYICTAAKVCS